MLSVFFIWGSFRKVTYRCRELALTLVSLQKKITLADTNFIESAKLHSINDRSNARILVANFRWGAGVLIQITQSLLGGS